GRSEQSGPAEFLRLARRDGAAGPGGSGNRCVAGCGIGNFHAGGRRAVEGNGRVGNPGGRIVDATAGPRRGGETPLAAARMSAPTDDPRDAGYRPPLVPSLPWPPAGAVDHPNLKELLYHNLGTEKVVVD